jgi:hypothetical protein
MSSSSSSICSKRQLIINTGTSSCAVSASYTANTRDATDSLQVDCQYTAVTEQHTDLERPSVHINDNSMQMCI